MIKYIIFYKEIQIGILEINEKNQYKYTPDDKGIETIKNEVPLIHEITEVSDWREPIPFFKNRIDNAKRFNREKDITTHTDWFRMCMQ